MFSEMNNRYKEFFFDSDLKQARAGLGVCLALVLIFIYNDYLFFGLSTVFYGLFIQKIAYVIFTIIFFVYLFRLKSYRRYYQLIFTWLFFGVIVSLTTNFLRPPNFLYHALMVVIIIFLIYLVFPQALIKKLVLSLTITIGELAIVFRSPSSVSATVLFSIFFSLVLTNLIGLLIAKSMESQRQRAFKNFDKLHYSEKKYQVLTEKLRVVGSLTRHDVGNKLMAAKSNVYLLKKRVGDDPDLAKYLNSIDSALASSDEIFEFSRLYEKIGVEKTSKENVFESFNQAKALMKNFNNVKVVNECQGLQVTADSLLKQLFYNLIDNSLKHGEKVTQISLHYSENVDGLKLFYEDNGVGIPEANKSKLFEAGFSTGKGSGLGLYLVKKMMDVYGWNITEEGEQGKGAKFVMTIPKLNKKGKVNYQIAH
jgi:signal transduction histidine kinase